MPSEIIEITVKNSKIIMYNLLMFTYLCKENLGVNESFESSHSFEKADLRKVTDFKLTLLDDSYKERYK